MLPEPAEADDDVVGLGADLEPGTLLAAYRSGLFPMRIQHRGPIAWWSPNPRGVIPLDGLHVSRSLRSSRRKFEIRVDTAFEAVIRSCADPSRPAGWIDEEFVAAYTNLHELGWAHSVESWTIDDEPELAGGLYGVAIGALFAAESMFHSKTDAGKAAVVGLVDRLNGGRGALLDVQWATDHLKSLGAREITRTEYLARLAEAIDKPQLTLE